MRGPVTARAVCTFVYSESCDALSNNLAKSICIQNKDAENQSVHVVLTGSCGRHHEALEHAQAAVVLLQEELSQMELNGDYHEDRSPETLNKMAVLAISYHNIGGSRNSFSALVQL